MEKFAKYLLTLFVCLTLIGCSTVKIPEYIQDEQPYSRSYFADYSTTLSATKDVLTDLGWEIKELKDPSIFERNEAVDTPLLEKVLIITDVKENSFFVGTRFSRLNVYVQSVDESKSDVEVRFLTVTSMPYSSIRSYEHEYSSERILDKIEDAITE